MIKRLKNFLWTTFLGGVLVLLPISILVWLIRILVRFFSNLLDPVSKLIGMEDILPNYVIDIIAFAAIIGGCFVVGLVIKTQIGRNLFSSIEASLLTKIPLYGTIKETVLQFSGAKATPFSKVVLVQAFDGKATMTAFVSDEHEDGSLTVFAPTAPNPTNGYLLHVQPEQIEYLDVTPEEAMRTIIGVGVGSSALLQKKSGIL